jgi:hypothetical protein
MQQGLLEILDGLAMLAVPIAIVVVREGSKVSNPSAYILDTGETLPTTQHHASYWP